MQGERCLLQLRGGVVFEQWSRGMCEGLEGSESLPAEGERGERCMAIEVRVVQCARSGNHKRELAGGVESAAADDAEAGNVDTFGASVNLEALAFEVITS